MGGVVLKGTLKGLVISATGGFVLFVLIQFVFDPFDVVPLIMQSQKESGQNGALNTKALSSETVSPKQPDVVLPSQDHSSQTNNLDQSTWESRDEGSDSYQTIEFKNRPLLLIKTFESGKLTNQWNGKWEQIDGKLELVSLHEPNTERSYDCRIQVDEMECNASRKPARTAWNYGEYYHFTRLK